MGAFRCLCAAEREPPSLPRHTWHAPLGFHILEAKVFAGWHGYVLLMRAEREEARQMYYVIVSWAGSEHFDPCALCR